MAIKRIALLIALALVMSIGGSAYAEETEQFTWWISRNEDISYYDNYSENPSLQYALSEFEYNGKRPSIDFWAGVSGSEKENFNNMLATGDLADVIDLMFSDYTPATLYEDGYIIDLTTLVQDHMPNYWKLINENRELAEFVWSYVDGEKMILTISGYDEVPEPFEGYCYRRDWIAKYGTNPVTGEPFTYGIDEDGHWYDDVVFPCGEDTPYYISDWEWMFEIFTRAMAEHGIDDGYCISICYQGFMSTGDMYSGFGGGCPWWYRDADDVIRFGGNTDTMRAYMKCMHTWYENGWLDASFAERSGDIFYIIDSSSVHQGKVGMWQGRQSEIGNQMDIGSEYTDGIIVYGCPQPINDVYGGEEQQNHVPDCYYAFSTVTIGPAVTTAAADKDLPVLLNFIDGMFSEEGGRLAGDGISREQLNEMSESDPWYQTYKKFGLDNGMYYAEEENGNTVYYYSEVDPLLGNAMKLNRFPKLTSNMILHTAEERPPVLQHAIDMWLLYPATGYIHENIEGMLSTSDAARKAKVENNLLTYMSQNVPKFIIGLNGFDIDNDEDWSNFATIVSKYGVDRVTDTLQAALDALTE